MKLYKLTDEYGRTYGGCQWGEGIEHTASGEGELCGPGWLHVYIDPLLAVLLNPIDADFKNPRLWEAEGDVGKRDHDLKVGCTWLKTIREIPLPKMATEQRVRFAILCALTVVQQDSFVRWATDWLGGKDRTQKTAEAAAWAAAGVAAARVAEAAAKAAGAAAAAKAAAAEAAAWAAWAAAWAERSIDLPAIARKACEF